MILVPKAKRASKTKDSNTCVICERERVSDDYCEYHDRAYKNVIEYFDEWQRAYGELSYAEYLEMVMENPSTGLWARSVAEYLLKKEKAKK